MTLKSIRICILITIMSSFALMVNAQVTIGNNEKPSKGVLLEIKDINNVLDGSTNATKGLCIPRVKLTDLNNLFPMYEDDGLGDYVGASKLIEDRKHTGLIVYNINKEILINPIPEGLYVWTGSNWLYIK